MILIFSRIRPVQKYPGLNLGAEAGAAGAFVAAAAAARSEAAAGAAAATTAGEAGAAGAFVAAADAKRISQHTVSSLSPPHVGLAQCSHGAYRNIREKYICIRFE